MKILKTYDNFIFENLKTVDDIDNDRNTENLKWDISEPGIKIWFDITPYEDESQTPYGKLLILANTMRDLKSRYKNDEWKNTLIASTHVGFIFSDGRILHATSEFKSKGMNGVQYEDMNGEHVKDINDNPRFYVMFNIGGDEKDVEKIGNDIINYMIKMGTYGKSYDWSGIDRIFPDLKSVLNSSNGDEFNQGMDDNDDEKDTFYCSQFVAYILVKMGIVTLDELRILRTVNGDLDPNLNDYDVNPTDLYEYVSKIGKKLKLKK